MQEDGWPVEVHDDNFPQETKDAELLCVLGEKDWVLLTQDERIRYRSPERDAYLEAGLRIFAASSANLTAQATAAIFLKAREKIENVADAKPGPFIYSLRKDSTLHRLD